MIGRTGSRSGAGRLRVAGRGSGSGLLEDLPDGVARVIELAGDLADGLAVASRPSNGTVIVHRKHVLDPPCG